MPSHSRSQQRLFGQAAGLKSGSLKKGDINPKYYKKIKQLASSMSLKKLKEFAQTKHSGLPDRVQEKLQHILSYSIFETTSELHSELYHEIENMLDKKPLTVDEIVDLSHKYGVDEEYISILMGDVEQNMKEDIRNEIHDFILERKIEEPTLTLNQIKEELENAYDETDIESAYSLINVVE